MRSTRFRLLVTLLATIAACAILWQSQWLSHLLQALLAASSDKWTALAPETRELLGFTAVVMTIPLMVAALVIPIWLERRKRTIQPTPTTFPFEQFSTDNIEVLKFHRLGQLAELPYTPRFLGPQQEAFQRKFDAKLLMLTGRRGLGKTRECIEAFSRLAKEKGEPITILYPKVDFDRPHPSTIPTNFSPRNVILFIDEVEARCAISGRHSPDRLLERGFHERLSATITWLSDTYAGRDWRVVLTAVDEPAYLQRLQLGSGVWAGFTIRQLPAVNRRARPRFVREISHHMGLTVEPRALRDVSNRSDGTPAGMIIPFQQERSEGSPKDGRLTRETLAKYSFKYPADWYSGVYRSFIEPFAMRRAVFEALSAIHQLHLHPSRSLVIDLAAALGRRRKLYLFARARARRAIEHDLQAWMFEYRGEIICPKAYLDLSINLRGAAPLIVKSLARALRSDESGYALVEDINQMARFALDLGTVEPAIQLLQGATSRYPRYASLWTSLATLQAYAGQPQEQLRAAEIAAEVEPNNSFALIALASARSAAGDHHGAIETSRLATRIAPQDDFVWLNLGVVLSKRGLQHEAICALQKACEINPISARAWYSLGVVFDQCEQREKAIEACRRAVDLDPIDADAWHTLGIACDRFGDTAAAIDALSRVTELEPKNGSGWLSLARTLFAAGQSERALTAFLRSEAEAADNVFLLSQVARQLTVARWHDHAMRIAQKAIAASPASTETARIFAQAFLARFEASAAVSQTNDLKQNVEEHLKQWFSKQSPKGTLGTAWPMLLAEALRTPLDSAGLRELVRSWLETAIVSHPAWLDVWIALAGKSCLQAADTAVLIRQGYRRLTNTRYPDGAWPLVATRLLELEPGNSHLIEESLAWLVKSGVEGSTFLWTRLVDLTARHSPSRESLTALGRQWFATYGQDWSLAAWPSVVSRLIRLDPSPDIFDVARAWCVEVGADRAALMWMDLVDRAGDRWPHRQEAFVALRQWFESNRERIDTPYWPNVVSRLVAQTPADSDLLGAAWKGVQQLGIERSFVVWTKLFDVTNDDWPHRVALLDFGRQWCMAREEHRGAAAWQGIVPRLVPAFPEDHLLVNMVFAWLDEAWPERGVSTWIRLVDGSRRDAPFRSALTALGRQWFAKHGEEQDRTAWPRVMSRLVKLAPDDEALHRVCLTWLTKAGLNGAGAALWNNLFDGNPRNWNLREALLEVGSTWCNAHLADEDLPAWVGTISRLLSLAPAHQKVREAAWLHLEKGVEASPDWRLWRALVSTSDRSELELARIRTVGRQWAMGLSTDVPQYGELWERVFDAGEHDQQFIRKGIEWAVTRLGQKLPSFVLPKIFASTRDHDDALEGLMQWLTTNSPESSGWCDRMMIVLKAFEFRKASLDVALFKLAKRSLALLPHEEELWGPLWVSLYEQAPDRSDLIALGVEWLRARAGASAWPSVWLRLTATDDILGAEAVVWLANPARATHNKWPDVWTRMWERTADVERLGPLAVEWLRTTASAPRYRDARRAVWKTLHDGGWARTELALIAV